jgi:hypothetical protein
MRQIEVVAGKSDLRIEARLHQQPPYPIWIEQAIVRSVAASGSLPSSGQDAESHERHQRPPRALAADCPRSDRRMCRPVLLNIAHRQSDRSTIRLLSQKGHQLVFLRVVHFLTSCHITFARMNLADDFQDIRQTAQRGWQPGDALFIKRSRMTSPKVSLNIEALLS